MTPTWPASINHLAERGSWQLVPNEPVMRSEFEYGPARTRRRFTKQVTQFNFTVKLDELEYAQFEGFFQEDLGSGAAWFNMPVYLGRNGYETKLVRFTSPYQASDAGYRHVKVSAKLEVKSSVLISSGATYFVSLYGEEALNELNDPLEVIVNETYPTLMENRP